MLQSWLPFFEKFLSWASRKPIHNMLHMIYKEDKENPANYRGIPIS
jgi:hypothetical protein